MRQDVFVYVRHMRDACSDIEKFTKNMTKGKFLSDKLVQAAVIRCLEVLGEACKHVTSDMREDYKHIEWKKIAGMRDILIHEYFAVDNAQVWNVVRNRISPLKKELDSIIRAKKKKGAVPR
jgi:uncharacterized protein with HEPN domain